MTSMQMLAVMLVIAALAALLAVTPMLAFFGAIVYAVFKGFTA